MDNGKSGGILFVDSFWVPVIFCNSDKSETIKKFSVLEIIEGEILGSDVTECVLKSEPF